MSPRAPHVVVALALPGTVLLDLAAPAHLFGHCGAGRYRFDTVAFSEPAGAVDDASADGGDAATASVPTTSGLAVTGSAGPEALAGADTLVVPGYRGAADAPPPAEVLDALRSAAGRGARVMSVCTGAFALAHAGLLDGRRATTHWDSTDRLADDFPAVAVDPRALYVDEGQILTSAGVAAGLDLCLHVVRRDHGAQFAAQVARRTVIAPHRAGGQAQYVARPLSAAGGASTSAGGAAGGSSRSAGGAANGSSRSAGDVADRPTTSTERAAGLAATRAWASEHLGEPLDVARLAAHANVSPRTFARRFVEETGTTPARWIAGQRIALALELLETTDDPVDQVAWRCGFGTAATLRARLRAAAQTTPTEYRRAFTRTAPAAG